MSNSKIIAMGTILSGTGLYRMFHKTYDEDSAGDIERDVAESFDILFNPHAAILRQDDFQGELTVEITYKPAKKEYKTPIKNGIPITGTLRY